jgi:hypothetical protein
MSTALKHILRIGGTQAALTSGPNALKNNQIGIATDTKKFVYRDASGTFHICAEDIDITDLDVLWLNALEVGEYPTATAGGAFIFYSTDGKLRIQRETGDPEEIVTTQIGGGL